MEPEKGPSSPSRKFSGLLGLLGILAFAFGAWFLSKMHTPNDESRESVTPQDTPRPKAQGSDSASRRSLIVHPPVNPNEPHYCCEHKTPRWEKAAVLIALGLLVVNAFQMCATKKSSDMADKTLRLTFRPRITIGKLLPQQTPFDNGKLALGFDVLNYGPITATDLKVFRFENISDITHVSLKAYREPLRDYPKTLAANGSEHWGIYGEKIFSQEQVQALARKDNLPLDASNKQQIATFSVLIEYRGDLSDVHHSEICILYALPPQPWWTYCPWQTQND